MAQTEHDLEGAYALRTPADSRRYYRDWAESYDSAFARATAYRSPGVIAAAYAGLGGRGPVLDVGAGTGLVGEALQGAGIGPVDGIDISAEMLAAAERKRVYRRTIQADLTQRLDLPDVARGVWRRRTDAGRKPRTAAGTLTYQRALTAYLVWYQHARAGVAGVRQ